MPTLTYGSSLAHEEPPRRRWQPFKRGFAGRCPACGEGRIFRKYLKVAESCTSCGEELHHQRADDAPPVIKKIYKKGTAAEPLCGLFETTIKGKSAVVEYEPDPDLRDTEQVPLLEAGGIEAYLRREVLPHATDAWYVADSIKTGYEISFTRYFYKPQPLRTLDEIRADILAVEKEAEGLLDELVKPGPA